MAGFVVRFDRLTVDELRDLADLPAFSDEARRVTAAASTAWFDRVFPKTAVNQGRWPLLVWFTATERILEPDELAAALERCRAA